MIEKKTMTIAELLAWATSETRIAESLERMAPTMPDPISAAALEQAEISRARSRWLDLQVEYALDLRDEQASG